jgi:hypothetical protein
MGTNDNYAYLKLSSRDATDYLSPNHNPADFIVRMGNVAHLTQVRSLTYTDITIPRMFPTIDKYNNTLSWYQRKVVIEPTEVKDYWLRTVANDWTETKRLEIPPGIKNIADILAAINAVSGPDEVWSYDSTLRSIVITTDVSGVVPVTFGVFYDAGTPATPTNYANMTYITGGGGTLFDTLGIQRAAGVATSMEDRLVFSKTLPGSFDTTKGSNLEGKTFFPLFDRAAHNYTTWSTVDWTSPTFNPPNITGPTTIHVCLVEVGDASAIHAATGLSYDVLATVNISSVDFGQECHYQLSDKDANTLVFRSPKNIQQFHVELRDSQFRQLTLPRNYAVGINMQAHFSPR